MSIIRKSLFLVSAIIITVYEEFGSSFIKPLIISRIKKRKSPYLFYREKMVVENVENVIIEDYDSDSPIEKRFPLKLKDIDINPNEWIDGNYYIEEHNSNHLHNDFSIIIGDKVYRMARTPSKGNVKKGFLGLFPAPDEKVGWIIQPKHYVHEVPNPAFIKEGYGAGTTKVLSKGNCLVNMSHGGNMHVIFEGVEGTYVFVDTKDNNALMIRKLHKPINFGKHKMIDKRNVQDYLNDPSYLISTKKDGAGVEWKITESNTGHKHLQVFSWRPDAKLRKKYGVDTQIEHTQRLKLCDKEVNPNTPLAEGRGEIWCKGENGLIHVNKILNSLPFRSRKLPYNPYLYIHDLVNYEGKNVESLSYDQKLVLMQNIHEKDMRFKIPKYTINPKAKQKMWNHCKAESGIDGVVAWKLGEENTRPIKLKFKHDTDNWYSATIVDIIPQQGDKNYLGYPVLENEFGKQFTCSGVGLNESTKSNMLNNPDNWIGNGVRYSAERHFESGVPFQPIIKQLNSE